MFQETQTGALCQPRGVGWGGRWEGGSKGRDYIYTYGWFMLRFDRKQQNSVKQLSFNKKINLKKILNSTEQIQFTFFHLIKPVTKERKPEGRQERKTAVRKWKRMKKSNLKNLRYFKSPKHSYEILRLAFSIYFS